MYSFFTYLQQHVRDMEEEEREQICLASEKTYPYGLFNLVSNPSFFSFPPRKAPQGDPPRARGAVRPEHHPL